MSTHDYLARLDRALRPLASGGERRDIVRYYREYLEEAGAEAEQAMRALGEPEALARASVPPPGHPPSRGGRRLPRRAPDAPGSQALIGVGFRSVRVDVAGAQVRLDRGEAFLVRPEDTDIRCRVEQGVLFVTGGEGSGTVHITIPADAALDEVRVRTRGGDIAVGAVEIGRLAADAGRGEVALRGTRAAVLDLRSAGGISAPGSGLPQRLRGRMPRRSVRIPPPHENERRLHAMKTNVFLRSTRRQPVRALCLVLVMLFAAFAFVGRVSEYLLIKQETERLEGYYRAIGTLEGGDWADTSEAAAYLERHPLVQTVNTYHYTSGVIEDDICNADTDAWLYDMYSLYFYGTLLQEENHRYTFRVDQVLTGQPEYIWEGAQVVLLPPSGSWDAADPANLPQVGERCLAAGHFNDYNSAVKEENDGFRWVEVEALPLSETCYFTSVPAEGEADWSDPALRGLEDEIRHIRDQQHALNIIPLRDMTALPMVQESDPDIYLTEGRWLDSEDDAAGNKVCVINANFASMRHLSLGDTLTIRLRDNPSYFGYYYDFYTGGPGGYEKYERADLGQTSTDTYEIVGIYDYMEEYPGTAARNYTYIPASLVPEGFQFTTAKAEKSYLLDREYFGYFMGSFTIRKDHGIFEGVRMGRYDVEPPPMPGTVSFLLKDAETQTQFEAETKAELEALGFRAVFLPNGLEAFQTASRTMRQSSLFSALIYSAILAAALALAVFVYLFLRRHDLAIVRALGVPVGRCVGEISLPMLLLGLAAVPAGSVLGWRHTLAGAAGTLEALSDLGEGTVSSLPVGILALLAGGALALLAALTLGTAWALARVPVLRQVQGGAPAGAGQQAPSSAAEFDSSGAPRTTPAIVTWTGAAGLRKPLGRRRSLGAAYTLRFVWRHITRAKVKTALAVALAAVFTVGLAAIRLAIAADREEIERLYETTSVTIELTKADSTQSTPGGAFLFEDTLQTVMDTGYILDTYVEGGNNCSVFRYDGEWSPGQALAIRPEEQTARTIRSIDSEEKFLTIGSGANVTITYLDGWDGTLFSDDWDGSDKTVLLPIVLPKETFDQYAVQPGDALGVACKEAFRMCAVAGYYEGQVVGEHSGAARAKYDESAPILMPTSALRTMMRNMLYSKAVFTVDPSRNRDLDAFRAAISDLANRPRIGGVPVRTVLWDQELRLAVEPLEKAVELMELLYPVALVLSLLSAAGAAALLVVLSAKEAAILRVQGTTRSRTVLMLALQQLLPCCVGLVLGLTGILLYLYRIRPPLLPAIAPGAALCAALYLAAGAAGALAASALLLSKNPLEMLQVKE